MAKKITAKSTKADVISAYEELLAEQKNTQSQLTAATRTINQLQQQLHSPPAPPAPPPPQTPTPPTPSPFNKTPG